MKMPGWIAIGVVALAMLTAANAGEWWEVFSADPPEARMGHSLTALDDGKVYLFGGLTQTLEMRNDLHVYWDDEWGRLDDLTVRPPPRRNHAAWGMNGRLYVMGGVAAGGSFLSDLWEFDPAPPPAVEPWRHVGDTTGMTARAHHAAVPLPNGDVMFFGGQSAEGVQKDVWIAHRGTGEWRQVVSMPHNWSGGFSHLIGTTDVVAAGTGGGRVYGYSIADDEWTWDDNGPPLNGYASSFVVPAEEGREKIVAFGGYDTNYNHNTETYEFRPRWRAYGGSTTTRVEQMPRPTTMPAVAVLPRTTTSVEAVVFGGMDQDHTARNETWLYSVPAAPRPARLEVAQDSETPAFGFYGEPGYVYDVERTRSLTTPDWEWQATYTGTAENVQHYIPGTTVEVYRVRGNRPD